jgi:hypothetical protein
MSIDATERPGADLEYDLAHEARGAAAEVDAPHEERITVVTGTPDYDGDYSYDLAHDIPGR